MLDSPHISVSLSQSHTLVVLYIQTPITGSLVEFFYSHHSTHPICSPMFYPLDAVSLAVPSPYYRVVHFDVSGVDLTNSTLVKAEFRIFRAPNPQAKATEQRVEVFQVAERL